MQLFLESFPFAGLHGQSLKIMVNNHVFASLSGIRGSRVVWRSFGLLVALYFKDLSRSVLQLVDAPSLREMKLAQI